MLKRNYGRGNLKDSDRYYQREKKGSGNQGGQGCQWAVGPRNKFTTATRGHRICTNSIIIFGT
jgi:hypothetical protein